MPSLLFSYELRRFPTRQYWLILPVVLVSCVRCFFLWLICGGSVAITSNRNQQPFQIFNCRRSKPSWMCSSFLPTSSLLKVQDRFSTRTVFLIRKRTDNTKTFFRHTYFRFLYFNLFNEDLRHTRKYAINFFLPSSACST